MKNQVLKIVVNALGGAEDNWYRANMSFGKMTAEELKKKYGQSERTCEEILSRYQDEFNKLLRCVKWVENLKESDHE